MIRLVSLFNTDYGMTITIIIILLLLSRSSAITKVGPGDYTQPITSGHAIITMTTSLKKVILFLIIILILILILILL